VRVLLRVGASLVVVCATTCAHGTVMSSTCRYVPTVEDCVWEAQRDVTDACLRDCIIAGCRGVRVDCSSPDARIRCAALRKRGEVGGFAPPIGHDCTVPGEEISWCQVPAPERCRAEMMVHELAHRCGWRHHDGLGVPGNQEFISCD
jgi:hypothetical protein